MWRQGRFTSVSKAKFLGDHDPKVKYPKAIQAAFAEMRKTDGHEAWRYEQPLSTLASVPLVFIQKLREQFAPHVVETPRTHSGRVKYAWFVDPKVATEMRNELKKSL